MPTPEKEYYQKKLTAGTGISISPSNVISAEAAGSVNYYGTGLPTTAIGENGSLYMQYSVDVSTTESSIDNIYGKINDKWLEIETGSQITVDSVLSTVSTNPVENRVITNAVGDVEEALIAINGASFEDTIAALDAINGEVI